MFVQVIKGRTSDAAGLKGQLERWRDELKAGATGFVGSTVGIADDGTVVCVARFESADAAAANSNRPEQTAWWNETAKYFDGEPAFRESTDIATLFETPKMDSAAFVQVMEGKVADRAKAAALMTPERAEEVRAGRPDLLGSYRAWFDGGEYLQLAYFSSEADARKGESGDSPMAEEEMAAVFGDVSFVDLRDPLLD
jgi:hypothetical protein